MVSFDPHLVLYIIFSENLAEFFLVLTFIPMALHNIFNPLFLLRNRSFLELSWLQIIPFGFVLQGYLINLCLGGLP